MPLPTVLKFASLSDAPLRLGCRRPVHAPHAPPAPHTPAPKLRARPQVMLGLMVQPPVKGDASSVIYEAERAAILDSLKARAEMVNNSQ